MRRARDILWLLLSILSFHALAQSWVKLAPGIEYQDLNANSLSKWSHIHVFRIDLNYNELNLVMASELSHHLAFAPEFARHSQAFIALNGGFFDNHDHPLGLRINKQHEHNPLKYISWWGIFYIQGQTPHITNLHHFPHQERMDFALQSGPRLLINGEAPALKGGFAERSALGITATNKIIILVTENNPVSTSWLAERLKSAPLNCINALNLDGGSSSQLYAKIGHFHLNAPSFASVSDAIVVKPRS